MTVCILHVTPYHCIKNTTGMTHIRSLDEHGSHSISFLTVLIVSILIKCAAQCNLCDFINRTIVFFFIWISNSSFVFILHVPSLSCVGPNIFLSTLLSYQRGILFSDCQSSCFTTACYNRSYNRFMYLQFTGSIEIFVFQEFFVCKQTSTSRQYS